MLLDSNFSYQRPPMDRWNSFWKGRMDGHRWIVAKSQDEYLTAWLFLSCSLLKLKGSIESTESNRTSLKEKTVFCSKQFLYCFSQDCWNFYTLQTCIQGMFWIQTLNVVTFYNCDKLSLGTNCRLGRIVAWDELSLGTNCRLGRIVAWDELSLRTNCRLGRNVAWDELSLGTNCRLGWIVAWDELSLGTNCRLGRIVAWDELSIGTNCRLGRIVAWDELTLGTNCCFFKMRRIDAGDELSLFGIWDELSLETNCRFLEFGKNCRLGRIVVFWNLGRIVAWDELSLGTNCRLGRIVAWDELSLGRIVAWDELSLFQNATIWRWRRIVAFWKLGRIVAWDELSLFRIWEEL